jgi:hypothetical protein
MDLTIGSLMIWQLISLRARLGMVRKERKEEEEEEEKEGEREREREREREFTVF